MVPAGITVNFQNALLWIRIRMVPELCLDPDPNPELLFQIQTQLNMKEQISKNIISL